MKWGGLIYPSFIRVSLSKQLIEKPNLDVPSLQQCLNHVRGPFEVWEKSDILCVCAPARLCLASGVSVEHL